MILHYNHIRMKITVALVVVYSTHYVVKTTLVSAHTHTRFLTIYRNVQHIH